MSHARIVQTWPDGSKLDLTVETDCQADAIDEARVQVTRMFTEAMTVACDAAEDDDD